MMRLSRYVFWTAGLAVVVCLLVLSQPHVNSAREDIISLDLRDAPVEDALSAALGGKFALDIGENATRNAHSITARISSQTPEAALRSIASKAGVKIELDKDKVLVPSAVADGEFRAPVLDTQVFGDTRFLPNSTAALRILATNHQTGAPVRNAPVAVALIQPAQSGPASRPGFVRNVFRGTTDATGTANATFRIPALEPGAYTFSVTSFALGERDHITQSFSVAPSAQILLTTDKPVYQPGQVIHIRALALESPGRTPVAESDGVLEVSDAKGNKVFKQRAKTSQFGIVSADFQLANEITLGTYKITVSIGGASQEKSVNVERYVLPKFKVTFTPDKTWYKPGDTLTGKVSAQYFFGKPVSGDVSIAFASFDAGFNDFATVTGKLDGNGFFKVEQKLPDFFAGQPLEQGNAFVKAEVTVTDTAEHPEKATSNVPIAAQAMRVVVVPESQQLVPGVENLVYIVTSYPDGTPAQSRFTLTTGGGFGSRKTTGETDDSGVALVAFQPTSDTASVIVEAVDAQANAGTGKADIGVDASETAILLRTDRALYKTGETLTLNAVSPQGKSPVYFDVVRDGQAVLTRTRDLENGHASIDIHLGNDLTGTLEMRAWRIGKDGNIRRDTRVVYVDPANDLNIAVTPDKETYLPGEPAKVRFTVTGPGGRPRPSALGISIVDESVFALQDMQPGMEKVYFMLEKEILEPRYEIHGITPSDIVRPVPLGLEGVKRQRAAGALFAALPRAASAPGALASSWSAKSQAQVQRAWNRVINDAEAIRKALNAYRDAHKELPPISGSLITRLITDGRLGRTYGIDPWKRDYTVSALSSSWKDGFSLLSAGPDGKPGTEDDISVYASLTREVKLNENRGQALGWGGGFGGVRRGMVLNGAFDMGMPMPAAKPMAGAAEMNWMFEKDKAGVDTLDSAAPAPARVREYFPETLLFQPSLITDSNGRATLDVPMADSITTWRLSAMASTQSGALGSVTAPLRVFQDFFVDINFPVQLTQGDEVSVPVSVYNYLPKAQTVTLTADKEGWFQLMDDAQKSVNLGPNEVKGVKYRIKVTGLGFQKLTIRAQGTSRADAVRREVEIIPNGKRVEQAFNGPLTADVSQTVRIPEGSVTGAGNILVKVYPGVFSTVVEGMDKIFRMPYGCFEQTSSTTYPNVLVLDYTKRTKRVTPEIQMKAEQYINLGYQRLLSFEVQGGGFSWFGDAPANKVLTAYGLQEFADMSAVWDVDKAVIERTQRWEASQQNADGSWTPDANYIDEGLGPMWKSNLLATAYVTWGLAESKRVANGAPGAETRGMNYIKSHVSEANDAYAMAVLANAMLAAAPDDPATTAMLERLMKERIDDQNGLTHWKTSQATITFAGGDSADIEVTALAAYACIRSGRYPDVVGRALNWLISKRDPGGTWGTTQATVLTLKALLAGQGAQITKGSATIKVLVNGSDAGTVVVNEDNSDVMQQVDCKQYVKPGDNAIEMRITGKGQMMYGITAYHYTPWGAEREVKGPLDISVKYDRTSLAVNESLAAEVSIAFNPRIGPIVGADIATGILPRPLPKAANMVVVDLGIPPGFQVEQSDLQGLVDKKTITRFEMTGRQVILYFDKIEAGKPVTLRVHMKAQYPLRAQTPQSVAYQYYEPSVRSTASPVGLQVTE